MGNIQATESVHSSVAGGIVDKIQFTVTGSLFKITNRSTNSLYYRFDGIDPVVGVDGTYFIAPISGESREVVLSLEKSQVPEFRIISDNVVAASAYSIEKIS